MGRIRVNTKDGTYTLDPGAIQNGDLTTGTIVF